MKAIIIARVSTEEQKDARNSLPAQIARYAAELEKKHADLTERLKNFEKDNDEYFMTAKLMFEMAHELHALFLRSNVEERRIIISLVLWNLKFDGKNMLWELKKPFDMIIESCDQQEWCTLSDYFRTFSFESIEIPEIRQVLYA